MSIFARSLGPIRAAIALAALLAPPAAAVILKPGDVLISDSGFGNPRIVHIDAGTGAQTVIPVNQVGYSMVLDADGQILRTVGYWVLSLDPTTGFVTMVAEGGLIQTPLGLALEADGKLIIGEYHNWPHVIRHDPVTGFQEGVGTFSGTVKGVAVGPSGDIYIAPTLGKHIVRMTAAGAVVQDYSLPDAFGGPGDIHFAPNGELVIIDTGSAAVWKLNPANGVATELVPDGVFAYTVWGVFVTQDNRILVAGQVTVGDPGGMIYEVDPDTGALSVFASGGAIQQPRDVLVVETRPCDDGEDNDGDGLIDDLDPECNSPGDLSEEADCEDGLDNDRDGLVDFAGGDPGCSGATDVVEQDPGFVCDDGVDNDGDGAADAADDPGCDDAFDPSERSPVLVCDDGEDNDGDGLVDLPADPGCEAVDAPSEQLAGLDCDDGVDNDFDSLVDLADPGCRDAFSEKENPQCDDDIDNDNDGTVDWDGGQFGLDPDLDCVTPYQDRETPRRRGCGLGAELALLLPLIWACRRRSAVGR